jgi:hypothetical protein
MLRQFPKIANGAHRFAEQRRNKIKISACISTGIFQTLPT